MKIRQTELSDIKEVMKIYNYACDFMHSNGNPNQWTNGYPSEELIIEEIKDNHSFVCLNDNDEIIGTFCFILGEDPTYSYIENGKWLNNEPYGTIHRIASSGREKGIARQCINWCFSKLSNIRADTYKDNIIMQSALKNNGFKECGIIYIRDGSPRIAFHKIS